MSAEVPGDSVASGCTSGGGGMLAGSVCWGAELVMRVRDTGARGLLQRGDKLQAARNGQGVQGVLGRRRDALVGVRAAGRQVGAAGGEDTHEALFLLESVGVVLCVV